MSDIPSEVAREMAPSGVLRAAINLGNPVLAQGTPETPRGITVDLANELARRVGMPLRLVPFMAAGKVFDALKEGLWDVAFLAIEPVRAAEIAFTEPYVLIEGVYVVRSDSPLRALADVDCTGVRIAVNRGSAYDLFLTRTLKNAEIVRAENASGSFVEDNLEVLAGVRQPLEDFVRAHPGTRMIEGRFMEIRQAMGTPRGRDAAAAWLGEFIAEMKSNGFVAAALERSGQSASAAAPG